MPLQLTECKEAEGSDSLSESRENISPVDQKVQTDKSLTPIDDNGKDLGVKPAKSALPGPRPNKKSPGIWSNVPAAGSEVLRVRHGSVDPF